MSTGRTYTFAATLIALSALVLFLMGRVPICTCGTIRLWHGVVFSSENSQHLSDWYTFSHIIHGFVFYGLLHLAGRATGRTIPWGVKFLVAITVESGWEIFENTEFVINRYRETTIALDYFGDSILNSASDILAMTFGLFLASRLPVWTIITLAVAMELFTGFMIRDNLALNVLMLVWPLQAVLDWQNAGSAPSAMGGP
jgi:hypothetical protein